jgi:hypothetical protein
MERFDSRIEVGMQAIVIGTKYPVNSYLIGRVVSVEALTEKKKKMPPEYLDDGMDDPTISEIDGAIVQGEGLQHFGLKPNLVHISRKNLMPLPPLEELEQQKEKEFERV